MCPPRGHGVSEMFRPGDVDRDWRRDGSQAAVRAMQEPCRTRALRARRLREGARSVVRMAIKFSPPVLSEAQDASSGNPGSEEGVALAGRDDHDVAPVDDDSGVAGRPAGSGVLRLRLHPEHGASDVDRGVLRDCRSESRSSLAGALLQDETLGAGRPPVPVSGRVAIPGLLEEVPDRHLWAPAARLPRHP